MYCVKCGVELAPGEVKCPLCGTPAYMPEPQAPRSYPEYTPPTEKAIRYAWLYLITFLFIAVMGTCLFIDLTVNGVMEWAGYVISALIVLYCSAFLGRWFSRINYMALLIPIFASIALLLLYVNNETGGYWFLTFALPVVGVIFLLVELTVYLARYTRLDGLYIAAILCCLLGAANVLLELLVSLTFGLPRFVWSFFPLIGLTVIGIILFIIAGSAPLRESLHKRFFI